jgi:hypothetical protein
MKSLESLEKKNRFLGAKICFRSRDIKGPTRAWKPFAEEAVGLDLLALGIERPQLAQRSEVKVSKSFHFTRFIHYTRYSLDISRYLVQFNIFL